MDQSRWLIRLALVAAIANTLLCGRAWALVVAGGASVNTTSSGFNSVFYNVGAISNGTAIYLGDGWVLTAGHVNVTLTPGTSAGFNIPGVGTEYYDVVNSLRITSISSSYPGVPDLQLVQLAQAPPLPPIFQSIATSSPSAGAVVAMVGGGESNGGPVYWNAATSSSNGTVNLGNSSPSPYSGTPTPISSDTYWSSSGKIPQGTYQDAGFAWNGGERQWGESVVTFNNYAQSSTYGGNYNSNTFLTTFYNSTYDPPSSSFWGSQFGTVNSEVAAIGSNMASVASGDSGGAAFTNTGSGWSLAGMLAYVDQYDRTGSSSSTAYGDLSSAVNLSTYRSAILSVINSTVTWTGQAGNNTWDTTSTNWANAAHNGPTTSPTAASTANAIFGNTNPLLGIPLNSSLQAITVQSGGVSVASMTFTNTGSANGGVDYMIGGGQISGNPLVAAASGNPANNSIVLSGNGNGVGGAVYLTGANSFTGGVVVEAGRLNLQNGLALGNSSGVVIDSGGALELQTSTSPLTTSSTAAIPLTLNGSGILGAGALNNLSGSNTYAGPITLLSAVTIGSSSTANGDQLSITGGIDTVGNSFTFAGPGNTTISTTAFTSTYENNNYSGGTLIKTGSGTLTINFAAAGSPASNLLMASTNLTVGGGTFQINGAATGSTTQTLASLLVNSGATAIIDTSNGGSSNLTFSSPTSSALARSVGGTVDFTLPTIGSISFTPLPNVTGGIIGGWATVSGSSWATLSGSNIAAYSGATSVSSGSVALAGTTNYDVAGSFTASGAANSFRFVNTSTPTTLTLSGSVPIATGGILVPATVTSTDAITGGTLQGASGADLVVIQNSASTLTISSTIADNGAATGLTKSGSGALTLSASNSYTGPTTSNAGTLNINTAGALGGGTLIINGGTIDNTSGGSIITTNAETWSGSFAFNGSRPLSTGAVTLTTSPTITINNGGNNGILTIGGAIGEPSGSSFGLTLAGSGTLALNGTNTFTGGITINGGTLQVGSLGALNSSMPHTVSFGSTSSGTLNLNGDSVSVGGLSTTSTSATVEAAATAATAALTINGIGNYSFAGKLTGAVSLVKSGSGTQVLGGMNTSTGTTTVSGGVLEFSADSAMPAGLASITVGSGGTVADGTAQGLSQTLLGRIVGSSTGTVALAANSSNILDFSSATGANLPNVSLGSTGSYAYSGVLTPNGTNYNLGGGGGLLTISSMLSGGNSLTVLNGGDVAPAVANTYTGGTIIDSGTTLLISSDGSSGSAAELGLIPTSATTNITINAGTLQATSTFTLNANRGITLGTSGGTIDVDGITSNNSNTLTYNGVITGAGSLTLTDTGTLVLGGVNMYNGGTNINSGTLRAGIANTIPQSSAVTLGLGGTLQLNGFSQSIGSLMGGGVVTDNSATSATLTVGNDNTSPAAFYGVISDTNTGTTGTLALNKVGSGTLTLTGLNTYSGGTTVNGGTLIVAAAPSLAKNSQLVVNSGTLQFNVTSGTATVQSGVTATVAAAATLQLAGTVSALSDGSAINPADGQLVNVNNNGSTPSGGGLSVTGTNQSVGTITGSATSGQGAATTYSGDTVVGAGASLTATQILQNTLTIDAGASVTIRPSGPGIATNNPIAATSSVADSTGEAPVSGTALEIENIQNRIAVLEQLEATDSSSNASPLDETPSTLAGATSSVPNPANANLTSDSEASLLASEIATLQNRENLLLAEENSSSELGTLATAFSSTDVPAGGVGVPEPSGLLLTLTGAVAVALTLLARRGRRFSLAQAFYTWGIDRCGHRPFQRSRD